MNICSTGDEDLVIFLMFQSLGLRHVSAAKSTRPSNLKMIGFGLFKVTADSVLTSAVTIFVGTVVNRAMIAAELYPILMRLDSRMTFLENNLTMNAARLESRMTFLENKVSNLTTQISSLRTEIYDKFMKKWW